MTNDKSNEIPEFDISYFENVQKSLCDEGRSISLEEEINSILGMYEELRRILHIDMLVEARREGALLD